jgi:multidrug resistance efflux pump
MKSYAIPIALILALLLTSGCGTRRGAKPRMGEIERLPRLETVILGKPASLEVVRSYTATVEAFEKADLCAQVKGVVKLLPPHIDIGRVVKKDDLLVSLDVPDLVADRDNKKALVEQSESAVVLAAQAEEVAAAEVKESQALLKRYEADLEYRKLQHARITRLAQGDTLSQQQADEAQLQLNAAHAALTAGQAQVVTKQNRLKAAELEKQVAAARVKVARTDLDRAEVLVQFATLKAPFDGVITKRWVDTGTTVKDAGMPLLTLVRTDKVRVILDIPERDVPYIQVGPQGNRVELQVPALQDIAGSAKFHGSITLMASALDPVTRTMRVEMHLDNQLMTLPILAASTVGWLGSPAGQGPHLAASALFAARTGLLKPQMTGTAYVSFAVREALTVPASALVRAGNKMELYIVADPAGDPPRGTVKRLEVQLGLDDGLRVEIRNDRLSGRELVIVKGGGVMRPGDQVIAIPARPAE